MDNLSRRYLALVLIALLPSLHGCLWQSLHIKGEVDAEGKPIEKVEEPTQL
jgi:hypothetical protein